VLFVVRPRPLDAQGQRATNEFNDSHFHLTSCIQQGIEAAERTPTHLQILEGLLNDRSLGHVVFDISWDELAKLRGLVTGHYHPGNPVKPVVGQAIPIVAYSGRLLTRSAGNSVRAQRAIAEISNALGGNPFATRTAGS